MKKTFYLLTAGVSILLIVASVGFAAQREVPGTYATIQEAINAASNGDVINIAAGTFAGAVVNKEVTVQGAGVTTIITPSSGVGISVTANNVTLQNFRVTAAKHHGIYAGNVSGLTITNVTTDNNGTTTAGSGIALQGVTGTSVLTNITATNNPVHGLEIGNGCANVNVVGGTFKKNGTAGDVNTGGGIAIYADPTKSVTGTIIRGTLSSDSNKTAGIFITCSPGGTLSGTRIGMIADGTNSGTVTLNDNGSSGSGYSGGGAVIVYGPCDDTKIRANSTKTSGLSYETAGLIMLGTTSAGANSPTNTVAKDCNLSGFSTNSPAGTMKVVNGSNTLICTTDVDATTGNTINGVTAGFDVEDLLKHKVDSLALGAFKGPGSGVYVTPNSGNVGRGVSVAQTYSKDTVYVKNGTYNENDININSSLVLIGQGYSTIIQPNINLDAIHIGTNNVTIKDLYLTTTANSTATGIWDNTVKQTNINILNVKITNFRYATLLQNDSLVTIEGGEDSDGETGHVAYNIKKKKIKRHKCGRYRSTAIYIDPSSDIEIDSVDISNIGKSAIYLSGGNSNISISATISKGDSNGVGITIVGDETGQNTGIRIAKTEFTGFSSTKPAITLSDPDSTSKKGTTSIDTTGLKINLSEGQTIADVLYNNEDDATLGSVQSGMLVKAKVFLQGAYSGSAMTTTLATNGYLPLSQPYNASPYNYTGGQAEASSAFFTSNSVTDWILVQLRSTFNGAAIDTAVGLLKSDGTVLDTNGTEGLTFRTAGAGNYYIVIKHRNHLSIMSADSIQLPNASAYDFTTSQSKAYGAASFPMKEITAGTVYGMWAGDVTGNGQIKYSGAGNDRAPLLTAVGGGFAGVSSFGYFKEDITLNGQVKYSGAGNDRGLVLSSVGGGFAGIKNTTVP